MTLVFFTDRDLGTAFPEILKGAGFAVVATRDRIEAFLDTAPAPVIARVYRATPAALAENPSAAGRIERGIRSSTLVSQCSASGARPPVVSTRSGPVARHQTSDGDLIIAGARATVMSSILDGLFRNLSAPRAFIRTWRSPSN